MSIRYNLGHDKNFLVVIEIGFANLKKKKKRSRWSLKVVATLFLLPFTLFSNYFILFYFIFAIGINWVTTSYFSEFCRDRTFNVVT